MIFATLRYRPTPYSNPPTDPLSERAFEDEPVLMKAARHFFFLGGAIFTKGLLAGANT